MFSLGYFHFISIFIDGKRNTLYDKVMDFTDEEKIAIIQSDGSLLLEVHAPQFEKVRNAIAPFTELEKSPEHIHTYRITPVSLWNAASGGLTKDKILQRLHGVSRFPIPDTVLYFIDTYIDRFGVLTLEPTEDEHELFLKCHTEQAYKELLHRKELNSILTPEDDGFRLSLINRGTLKVKLIHLGYPVKDMIPLQEGAPLELSLRETTLSGTPFVIRPYQQIAINAFCSDGDVGTGYGTILLPCGAGKTIIGIGIMERFQRETLIVATNITALRQWIREILDKTSITPDQIGEYSGEKKEIRPITLCTYQVLTWKKKDEEIFPHFDRLRKQQWGLLIYDEVHLLPAPVFRITAEIQSLRRLGLTATLVREDHREDEVFSLIGPKRHDAPWKEIEAQGWIASAVCKEIRVPLPKSKQLEYALAENREKYRIAAENPDKITLIEKLLEQHKDDHIIIIGHYIDQLQAIASRIKAPIITGSVSNNERDELYDKFKRNEIQSIVVSKVANFSIDLPDASVAIQVSGTFGSRQEEAQRLGRILRPKERSAVFYSLVTQFSKEEQFALNRQRFLSEQGYRYEILNSQDILNQEIIDG